MNDLLVGLALFGLLFLFIGIGHYCDKRDGS